MRAALLLLAWGAAGCALLGQGDPVVPRYFAPDFAAGPPASPPRPDLQLRLGRVEGGSHLRERLAVRGPGREFVFSDDLRWTERPEVYLRRALARALFEERGLVQAVSGRAITLEVELLAFEEVEEPHRGRLEARLVLRNDRVSLLEETIAVEHPIEKSTGADPVPAVIEALSEALRAGVARIADRVVARLAEQAPAAHGEGEARLR
ncbi:MAG: membrane integrity-associated transporter subunit PqiC [Deltaproteobacteria bacterium]|nr:membrane integrity-associated transporter subunit PqiC [Deltaproteobacteria bacterium]